MIQFNYRLLLLMLLALLVPAPGRASSNLNEVGAALVYPLIVGVEGRETLVTITNAGFQPVTAHVAYINGDPTPVANGGSGYCAECDFDLVLSGNDTEMLVVTWSEYGGTTIEAEDGSLSMSCPYPFGMIVVTLEDAYGVPMTDNVLLGEEIVVDYYSGQTHSISAIPFQGKNGGNLDRALSFDDQEYGKLPRIVATSFISPNHPSEGTELTADLVLFTPGFERGYPPLVDCSVTGYDADEQPFSASFQFGCWAVAPLCDISPEFCYPNLGLYGNYDTHGWLMLNCRVDQDNDGEFDASGGVHGALVQTMGIDATIRRNDPDAPTAAAAVSWSRPLFQSVTTGDPVTMTLGADPGSLD